MNRYLCLIFPCAWCLLLVLPGRAQNLVQNPSFEDYGTCPARLNDLTLNGWTGTGGGGTPDYFNACYTAGGIENVGVPANFIGWQQARTGQAYCGIVSGSLMAGLWREYLQSRLLAPLVSGRQYYVSFWVSRAEIETAAKVSERSNIYRTGQIGAYFTSAAVTANNTILTRTPQVANDPSRYLDDTVNWQRVDGVFTASGGEEWIVLGNFASFRDQVYDVQQVNPSFADARNYFFIDDVCVRDLSAAVSTSVQDVVDCAASSAGIAGPDTMESWHWNTGEVTREITVLASGTYWVQSFRECEFRVDTFQVYLDYERDLINDTVVCGTDPVTLMVSDTTLTGFLWSTGGTGRSVSVSDSGMYWVEAGNRYCSVRDSAYVRVVALREPVRTDTVICMEDPLSRPRLAASPADGQYLWSTGEQTREIFISQSGVYWVRAADDCRLVTDTFFVEVERSELVLSDTFLCGGEVQTIDVGNPRYHSYRWHDGTTDPELVLSEPGAIWVSIGTGSCTFSDTAYVSLRTVPPPAVADAEVCEDRIAGFVWPVQGTGLTWYAYPGAQGTAEPPLPSADSSRTLMYVTQSSGTCESEPALVRIDVIRCAECVHIPNAFSPNGDGRNDYFRPVIAPRCPVRSYFCTVYNRLGEPVYRSEDPAAGWDGTYKGMPAEPGTYFFEMRFSYEKGDGQEYVKGDITLIR